MPPETARTPRWHNPFVQFLLTYAMARTFGWVAGIRYNVLSDAFDALRLAVDVALWIFCWTAVGVVLSRVARVTQPVNSRDDG